jgi:hypothetical protein
MLMIICFCLLFFSGCAQSAESNQSTVLPPPKVTEVEVMTSPGDSIATRIAVPNGFTRTPIDSSSFGAYLRNLPLKASGSPVYCYDGSLKRNQSAHTAGIELDVGSRDLQQCADAVMRLRAEYLWQQKQYDAIQFHFTNGFLAEYSRWRAGQRIKVSGNQVSWINTQTASSSYKSFRAYLTVIFAYAGTLSLAKELKAKSLATIEIGDVFVQGGSPGHAVIVVDLAHDPITGEKLVLLAQSYMPAQDIHVLKNPKNADLSPWYAVKEMTGQFRTPEWDFAAADLKHF